MQGRPPKHSVEVVDAALQRAEEVRNTPRRYVTEREVERAIQEEFGINRTTFRRLKYKIQNGAKYREAGQALNTPQPAPLGGD